MLRRIKREAGIEEGKYKIMYPTLCTPQVLWVTQNPQNWYPHQAYCI